MYHRKRSTEGNCKNMAAVETQGNQEKGIWSKRGYGDLGRAEKPTLRLARGVEYDSFF